jgi:hypothetical protein
VPILVGPLTRISPPSNLAIGAPPQEGGAPPSRLCPPPHGPSPCTPGPLPASYPQCGRLHPRGPRAAGRSRNAPMRICGARTPGLPPPVTPYLPLLHDEWRSVTHSILRSPVSVLTVSVYRLNDTARLTASGHRVLFLTPERRLLFFTSGSLPRPEMQRSGAEAPVLLRVPGCLPQWAVPLSPSWWSLDANAEADGRRQRRSAPQWPSTVSLSTIPPYPQPLLLPVSLRAMLCVSPA